MTEKRCETCVRWTTKRNMPYCDKLHDVFESHSFLIVPPADFGCIYHEARPEKNCGTCYWRSDGEEPRPGCSHPSEVWHLCIKRSKAGERIAVRDINACDQWRERHG
jgi:hypothetical protein